MLRQFVCPLRRKRGRGDDESSLNTALRLYTFRKLHSTTVLTLISLTSSFASGSHRVLTGERSGAGFNMMVEMHSSVLPKPGSSATIPPDASSSKSSSSAVGRVGEIMPRRRLTYQVSSAETEWRCQNKGSGRSSTLTSAEDTMSPEAVIALPSLPIIHPTLRRWNGRRVGRRASGCNASSAADEGNAGAGPRIEKRKGMSAVAW